MKRKAPAGSTATVPTEIPTASMADVAFLLLIFFLVAATFAATQGLDLSFDEVVDDDDRVDPLHSVLVTVEGGGALTVDGRRMPLGGLIPHLEPILAADPEKPVIVRTRPAAPYGAMVDVLDELRLAERRGLGPIRVAIPTEREVALYWPSESG